MNTAGINSCIALAIALFVASGCRLPPPGGPPIDAIGLGTAVDSIHHLQEQNAEAAKLIIYSHEFEINLQPEFETQQKNKYFVYEAPVRSHGYRLTPDGEEHVRKIGNVLLATQSGHLPFVFIERSTTSRQWDSQHEYPIHQNSELDELRRNVVVSVLYSMGIANADQIVLVAPAFPTGLSGIEAAAAYQSALQATASFRSF